jgi:hypothetical protein
MHYNTTTLLCLLYYNIATVLVYCHVRSFYTLRDTRYKTIKPPGPSVTLAYPLEHFAADKILSYVASFGCAFIIIQSFFNKRNA